MTVLHVAGMGIWAPGFPDVAAWHAGRPDPAVTAPICKILPPRLARFTSLLTRMTAEVVAQAGEAGDADMKTCAVIAGSASGEIQTAIDTLRAIAEEGLPSPARFKNSVHNTAGAHVSIATGNMESSTAIAAGDQTFAMCLIEALAWIERRQGSVILAVGDEPLPSPIDAAGKIAPLAVAFFLASDVRGDRSRARISGLRRARDGEPRALVPAPFENNPAASALALFDAVLQRRSCTVPVDLGGAWTIDVDVTSAPNTRNEA